MLTANILRGLRMLIPDQLGAYMDRCYSATEQSADANMLTHANTASVFRMHKRS